MDQLYKTIKKFENLKFENKLTRLILKKFQSGSKFLTTWNQTESKEEMNYLAYELIKFDREEN
ncbi:hypothetical protein BpHYR1_046042 [Brachionus plicatilis]|uniref:Uncharacterized protein n=1 Tax=Brachionus plicatilis TaxID=10195 RepID=A0A3M7P5E1_BRAPC|nr:hypothetical protein BpHYR1_046042 [Brachionus plicatilis]